MRTEETNAQKNSQTAIDKILNTNYYYMYNYNNNFEKIFSYWIFVWFLIYFVSLQIFRISIPNPYFALCGALTVNGIELSYTIFNYIKNGEKDTNYIINTIGYIFTTIVIKILPIILMIKINKKQITSNGVISTITLLIIYYVVNPPITWVTPTLRRFFKV
jgi:hypothetical protein